MDNKQLKQLRVNLHLTQREMAERLGISRTAIAKIEAGENNMSKPVAILCQQLASHHLVVENP